jgi:hypothetical protein
MSVDGLHNIGEINIKVSACFFGKLVLTFGLAACDSQVVLKAACDFGKCSESQICHVHSGNSVTNDGFLNRNSDAASARNKL